MADVVTAVEVIRPYVLRVAFSDGEQRVVDVESMLTGEVSRPLREPSLFAQASVDAVLGTVVWPNGAALAPEFLRAGTPLAAR